MDGDIDMNALSALLLKQEREAAVAGNRGDVAKRPSSTLVQCAMPLTQVRRHRTPSPEIRRSRVVGHRRRSPSPELPSKTMSAGGKPGV